MYKLGHEEVVFVENRSNMGKYVYKLRLQKHLKVEKMSPRGGMCTE